MEKSNHGLPENTPVKCGHSVKALPFFDNLPSPNNLNWMQLSSQVSVLTAALIGENKRGINLGG